MLDALKRLFARTSSEPRKWDAMARWAAERQRHLKPSKDDGGFVIEGHADNVPWRLEWGPSQRPYVKGMELRIRAEPGMPVDLQLMILDRHLQASMEAAVFDQYVEGVQTRIDKQTPPEMRWLVMFPKTAHQDMGALRERFASVTSSRSWLLSWLDGALTDSLLHAPMEPQQAMVLMASRGRLTLRTALGLPSTELLGAWIDLFEVAARQVRQVATRVGDSSLQSVLPSVLPGELDTPSRNEGDKA